MQVSLLFAHQTSLHGFGLHWGVSLLVPKAPMQTLLIMDEWLRGYEKETSYSATLLISLCSTYTLKHVSAMQNLTRGSICVLQVKGQSLICGRLIKMLSHLKVGSHRYGGSSFYNSECQCSTYLIATILSNNTDIFFSHIYSFKIFSIFLYPILIPFSVLLQQRRLLLTLCKHKDFEEEEWVKECNFLCSELFCNIIITFNI